MTTQLSLFFPQQIPRANKKNQSSFKSTFPFLKKKIKRNSPQLFITLRPICPIYPDLTHTGVTSVTRLQDRIEKKHSANTLADTNQNYQFCCSSSDMKHEAHTERRGVAEAPGARQLIYSDSGQVPLHREVCVKVQKSRCLNDLLSYRRLDR